MQRAAEARAGMDRDESTAMDRDTVIYHTVDADADSVGPGSDRDRAQVWGPLPFKLRNLLPGGHVSILYLDYTGRARAVWCRTRIIPLHLQPRVEGAEALVVRCIELPVHLP